MLQIVYTSLVYTHPILLALGYSNTFVLLLIVKAYWITALLPSAPHPYFSYADSLAALGSFPLVTVNLRIKSHLYMKYILCKWQQNI